MHRRTLLQGAAAAPLAISVGISGSSPARAAAWPSDAFHAEDPGAAEALLFGESTAVDSDQISITAPDIAENGRVVPVEVSIGLPSPQTLALFSDGNPFPLLARAHFTPAVAPSVSIRVKMGQSANLIALVETPDGLFRATRAVKVTAGGCGG